VLEAGTNKGLSTSIIAQALHDRGTGSLETIELEPANSNRAKANIRGKPGFERVTFTTSDATKRMTELSDEGRKFGFIFIDHWHGYQATVEAAELVKRLLSSGGYVVFHDFLDPGNASRRHVYGVCQAVLDTIVDDERFEFAGTSGCCAIFRFTG
jgi:predicted O-methyltransferase YrrM